MTSKKRPWISRNAAFHCYAVLCLFTGISGLGLSTWIHPSVMAERLADAGQYAQWQSHRLNAGLKTDFRGIEIPALSALDQDGTLTPNT